VKPPKLILQDCLLALKALSDDSLDSLVTDPPAGISFMGNSWDDDKGGRKQWIEWMSEVMRECLRVMKPGAHGLVWALPRTSHWTATALEDAGFRVKDSILHCFGSGFPKSTNVKKQAEKAGISCVCDEDLSDMRNELDAERSVSSDAQSDMRAHLFRSSSAQDSADHAEASPTLSELPKSVHAEKSDRVEQSQDMRLPMPRCNQALASGVCCSPTGNCTDGTSGMDREKPCQLLGKHERTEQPSVEGRRDFQKNQRQLHRSEVSAVSCGVPTDGAQGRLHHGASTSDGKAHGPDADPNRGGASQGSQHAEQRDIESGMVPGQPITQACGRCGKARFAEGYGSALKPAIEIWWLIQKPLEKNLTISANVLKWGCGALNIDASRIGFASAHDKAAAAQRSCRDQNDGRTAYGKFENGPESLAPYLEKMDKGRFPANLILSHTPYCTDTQCDIECAVRELDAQSGTLKSGAIRVGQPQGSNFSQSHVRTAQYDRPGDSGGASRFFYVAKISKAERNAGLEGMPLKESQTLNKYVKPSEGRTAPKCGGPKQNHHPTVKPKKLMTYLIRMVTPPGGTVLDPFMGSGSTGLAAGESGFSFVGIEKDPEYFSIASKRVSAHEP
jgi:DNA modification methylase